MRECTDRFVEHNSTMLDDFHQLSRSFLTQMVEQVSLTTYIDGIEGAHVAQFKWSSSRKCLDGFRNIVMIERHLCAKHWQVAELHHRVLREALSQIIRQCLCAGAVSHQRKRQGCYIQCI